MPDAQARGLVHGGPPPFLGPAGGDQPDGDPKGAGSTFRKSVDDQGTLGYNTLNAGEEAVHLTVLSSIFNKEGISSDGREEKHFDLCWFETVRR